MVVNPLLYRVLSDPRLRLAGVLVVVDDYYHGLYRVAERVARGDYIGDTIDPLSYLQWRGFDLGVAISLLHHGADVVIFNAKHRVETYGRLARLLLKGERGYRIIYFSHHIRSLREKAAAERRPLRELEEVREIEEFKKWLIDACPNIVLIEPTTVDELVTGPDGGLETRITRDNRWPHDYETILDYPYPVDLASPLFEELYDVGVLRNPQYVGMLVEVIRAQIVSRDLFYVSQSQAVVAYRPFMGGRPSHGVTVEYTSASAQGKPVYAYVESDEEYARLREMFTDFMVRRVKGREQLARLLRCGEPARGQG